MNIKNILLTIAVAGFVINNVHAATSDTITIIYNTKKKKYELIENFYLDHEPVTTTRDLNENTLMLIHDIAIASAKELTIASVKELVEQKTTPLKNYGVTFCSSGEDGTSKDFYVLQTAWFVGKRTCNDYINFVEEHIAQQQNN